MLLGRVHSIVNLHSGQQFLCYSPANTNVDMPVKMDDVNRAIENILTFYFMIWNLQMSKTWWHYNLSRESQLNQSMTGWLRPQISATRSIAATWNSVLQRGYFEDAVEVPTPFSDFCYAGLPTPRARSPRHGGHIRKPCFLKARNTCNSFSSRNDSRRDFLESSLSLSNSIYGKEQNFNSIIMSLCVNVLINFCWEHIR